MDQAGQARRDGRSARVREPARTRGASAHVAVVGGGIAGLAAAYFLKDAGVRVTLFESSPRIGGKLAVSEIAGLEVDEGAEAMLARRPEGTDLAAAVGLADQLVSPGTTAAAIWTRGALIPLPGGQVMGVPGDLAKLARSGVLSGPGLARTWLDLILPASRYDQDVAVATQVGARLGREVVDRLVEPLLGGVYAGRADDLSFEATLPGLAAAARSHRTLHGAARSVLRAANRSTQRTDPVGTHQGGTHQWGTHHGGEHYGGTHYRDARHGGTLHGGAHQAGTRDRGASDAPVFTTLAGGLGTLPGAVASASAARVRTAATVRELRRTAEGWLLTVGSARAGQSGSPGAGQSASPGESGSLGAGEPGGTAYPQGGAVEYVSADAVVLAVPARTASRLLRAEVPAAAALLGEIEYASMAIVTLVFPRAAFPQRLRGSGYLVPAVDDRAVKAVTFSTVKWPHLLDRASAQGRARTAYDGAACEAVRCSIGRIGEEQVLQRPDEDLVTLASGELAAAVGVGGRPVATRVSRWGGALPQYSVGHIARVARIRAAVAAQPGLAVCGAAYDGLGIPACIATAKQAAAQVLGYLAGRTAAPADEGK